MVAPVRRYLGLCIGIAFIIAILVLGSPLHLPNALAQEPLRFGKGINIHHALNWAPLNSQSRQYAFPPFADETHALRPEHIAAIRHAGFDFVRLTVDPGPFLQFQSTERDFVYEVLSNRVRALLDEQLAVVVDFHPITQNPKYSALAILADDTLFNAYCEMLKRTAALLAKMETHRISLEIMNEPPSGTGDLTDSRWKTLQEEAYRAVRSVAPKLQLVLTGGRYGGIDGLLELDPRPYRIDQQTIFSFHYYVPLTFTHQSLPGREDTRLAVDRAYPANENSFQKDLAALRKRVEASKTSTTERIRDLTRGTAELIKWHTMNFSSANIRNDFNRIEAWARRNEIAPSRILMGEFGVLRKSPPYDGAPEIDRLRWLRDVRTQAEAKGFSWAVWVYRGPGGFALSNESANIDVRSLGALGLLTSVN